MTRLLRFVTMAAVGFAAGDLAGRGRGAGNANAQTAARRAARPERAAPQRVDALQRHHADFDPDEPDETPDWIEIYNPTAAAVSLTGHAVTDDPSEPDKHVITQTLTIPPTAT
jgi:hypothetical protein